MIELEKKTLINVSILTKELSKEISLKNKNGKKYLFSETASDSELKQAVAKHKYKKPVFVKVPKRDKKAEWAAASSTEKINLLAKELGFK